MPRLHICICSAERCVQCFTQAAHASASPPYFDLNPCARTLQRVRPRLNLTSDALPHAQLDEDAAATWSPASRTQTTSAVMGALVLACAWLLLMWHSPIKRRRVRIPHRSDGDALRLFITAELLIAVPTCIYVAFHAARAFNHFSSTTADLAIPTNSYHVIDEAAVSADVIGGAYIEAQARANRRSPADSQHRHTASARRQHYDRSLLALTPEFENVQQVDASTQASSNHGSDAWSTRLMRKTISMYPPTPEPVATAAVATSAVTSAAATTATFTSSMDSAHEHSHFGSIAASLLAPTTDARSSLAAARAPPTSGTFGECLFVALSPEFASVEFIGVGVALIAVAIWALSHTWLSQFEVFLLLLSAPAVEAAIFFGESWLVHAVSDAWMPFFLATVAVWSTFEVILVQLWLYDLVSPFCDAEYIAPLDL